MRCFIVRCTRCTAWKNIHSFVEISIQIFLTTFLYHLRRKQFISSWPLLEYLIFPFLDALLRQRNFFYDRTWWIPYSMQSLPACTYILMNHYHCHSLLHLHKRGMTRFSPTHSRMARLFHDCFYARAPIGQAEGYPTHHLFLCSVPDAYSSQI